MSIYVDTSALIALLVAEDVNNTRARDAWQMLLNANERPVTSNYVVVECCALLQSRFGLQAVRELVGGLLPAILVAWVEPNVHNTGVETVLAFGKRGLSLVDCTSFALMRNQGIRRVFTFDPHFTDQGFEVIPKPGSILAGGE